MQSNVYIEFVLYLAPQYFPFSKHNTLHIIYNAFSVFYKNVYGSTVTQTAPIETEMKNIILCLLFNRISAYGWILYTLFFSFFKYK